MVNSTLSPEGNIATFYDGEEVLYNLGDMAWIIVATGLVMIMIPGEYISCFHIVQDSMSTNDGVIL